MTDNKINVEYDTDGVPSELPSGENVNGFSEELSNYLYPKLNTIENYDENLVTEFTPSQIQQYGLETNSNEDIDISTTRKLIKYLKAYSKKISSGLSNRVGELENGKLNITDYVVDRGLSETSNNPVANSVLYNELHDIRMAIGRCVGLEHAHNIDDVFGLGDALSDLGKQIRNKLDSTTFTTHTNANNPHNITPSKIGLEYRYDVDARYWSNPNKKVAFYSDFPSCTKWGNIVFLNYDGELYMNLEKGKPIFTLKSAYRPKFTIRTTVYRVGTGKTGTCNINPNGDVTFGASFNVETAPNDVKLRISECYVVE